MQQRYLIVRILTATKLYRILHPINRQPQERVMRHVWETCNDAIRQGVVIRLTNTTTVEARSIRAILFEGVLYEQ